MKTLLSKWSLALLTLLCLVGVGLLPGFLWTTRGYNAEVSQHLNHDLAAHLASHLADKELLRADFSSNAALQAQAKAEIKHLMVLNPDIEIYCLDEAGRILSYSSAPGTVRRTRVSLDPVRRFLAGSGPLPIPGDDPRSTEGQKVFSAALIPQKSGSPRRLSGFIYIILAGEEHDTVAGTLGRSYILRLGAEGLAGALLLVFGAGTLLAFGLTRRLRTLSREVDLFGEGSDLALRAPNPARPPRTGDEVGRLESGFVSMAARIRAQVEHLEQADVYRREAVSNVSHDLRTPLAALQGYLETLQMKEGTLSEQERRDYIATATRHAQRLGKLVSELFDLARLESGAAQMHLEAFSLAELVQDVTQQFELRAQQGGVQLDFELGETRPFVRGDIALLERAMENLIDNALRHTPPGGRVWVALMPGEARAQVRVSDTGEGIAPDELPRIFDRYYRAPREASQSSSGAGLGLAITRRIVELHGGTIEAQSAPGQGATFTFSLPLAV